MSASERERAGDVRYGKADPGTDRECAGVFTFNPGDLLDVPNGRTRSGLLVVWARHQEWLRGSTSSALVLEAAIRQPASFSSSVVIDPGAITNRS